MSDRTYSNNAGIIYVWFGAKSFTFTQFYNINGLGTGATSSVDLSALSANGLGFAIVGNQQQSLFGLAMR